MDEKAEIDRSVGLIVNHFSLLPTDLELQQQTFGELEAKLTSIVSYLLDKDMERLLQSLYRIDVDETLFKKILIEAAPEEIANKIAQEVIRRELQKVRLRAKYKGLD